MVKRNKPKRKEADVDAAWKPLARLLPNCLYRNTRGAYKVGNRFIRYGVGPPGATDYIGYRSMVITPDMVGLRIAVFAVLELKRPTEVPRDDQFEFLQEVADAGGIAIWADNEMDALSDLANSIKERIDDQKKRQADSSGTRPK